MRTSLALCVVTIVAMASTTSAQNRLRVLIVNPRRTPLAHHRRCG